MLKLSAHERNNTKVVFTAKATPQTVEKLLEKVWFGHRNMLVTIERNNGTVSSFKHHQLALAVEFSN